MYMSDEEKRRMALLTRNQFEAQAGPNDDVRIVTMAPKKKSKMSLLRRMLSEESPEMAEMMKQMRLQNANVE